MKRESNIELMRLILMLFIVVHHGIVHGLGLDGFSQRGGVNLVTSHTDLFFVSLTNSMLIFAVNAFVLVTGYFSVNLRKDKIVKLLAPVLLYSILFTTIPLLANRTYVDAIRSLFFLSHGPYWFILDYLFLMILSPIINEGYIKLDKHSSYILIGLLLVVNCYFGFLWGDKVNNNGYALMQFILMYIIGRHIRTFGINLKRQSAFLLYIISSLTNGVIFYIAATSGYEFVWKTTYYNNPLVIISAIFFFIAFLRIEIRSKIINYLSSSSLAIYLIQNTSLVGDYYYERVSDIQLNYSNILYSLGGIVIYSITICISAIFIDKLCSPALRLITNRVKN